VSAPPRIWLVGFGTVGQWLAERLVRAPEPAVTVVGLATARDGFLHDPAGIDLAAALELRRAGRPLRELRASRRFDTALDGIRATEAEVLVEVGLSPPDGAQPGIAHMREALARGAAVVTSNKWPVALAGTELAAAARKAGMPFRAESTVMSGTPVLGALTEGLAGARPLRIRGVLNATNNFILTRMGAGESYGDALAAAQDRGLAEPEPGADVGGLDTASKLMVLSALVFGEPLALDRVEVRGIDSLGAGDVREAHEAGSVTREVAELDPENGIARVGPVALDAGDPLAPIDGVENALVCEADPVGRITIAGPGAGPELAGQGVLSDLLRVVRDS
jgi:homoserine dehydrogenase